MSLTPADLQSFEEEVAAAWEAGRIRGPIHLGGDESGDYYRQLIEIFSDVDTTQDWIFCSYRSHCHALLAGVPREEVMGKILGGHSMTLQWHKYRFLASAIVGGQLPIAVGVALALQRQESKARVWAFLGDMANTTGIFHESHNYAERHGLRVTFVTENNKLSCDTPTVEVWGNDIFFGLGARTRFKRIDYTRRWPHVGTGKFVDFPSL